MEAAAVYSLLTWARLANIADSTRRTSATVAMDLDMVTGLESTRQAHVNTASQPRVHEAREPQQSIGTVEWHKAR